MLKKLIQLVDRICAYDHSRVLLPWFAWSKRGDGASRLHRYALQLDYNQAAPASVATKCLAAFFHLVRGTREIFLTWNRQKKACRTGYGISAGQQLRHLFIAVFRFNLPPMQYYRARLFRLKHSRWAAVFSHIETTLILATFEQNIPAPYDPWSKSGWESFCQAKGLPTIPIAAEAINGQLHIKHAKMLETGRDLFIKPNIDYSSLGAFMLIWDQALDRWQCEGACTAIIPHDGLADFLSEYSQDKHLVVQPRFRNHETLTDITKNSLVNVRIVTIKSPTTGYSILKACLRYPPQDEVISDVVGSTWVAPIDLESGRLEPAESGHLEYGLCARHPYNQSQIEGRLITDWHTMRDLAIAAHAHLPDMPTVGWDVVSTGSGLYILEANGVWNAHMTQQWGRSPLGETPWAEALISAANNSIS